MYNPSWFPMTIVCALRTGEVASTRTYIIEFGAMPDRRPEYYAPLCTLHPAYGDNICTTQTPRIHRLIPRWCVESATSRRDDFFVEGRRTRGTKRTTGTRARSFSGTVCCVALHRRSTAIFFGCEPCVNTLLREETAERFPRVKTPTQAPQECWVCGGVFREESPLCAHG